MRAVGPNIAPFAGNPDAFLDPSSSAPRADSAPFLARGDCTVGEFLLRQLGVKFAKPLESGIQCVSHATKTKPERNVAIGRPSRRIRIATVRMGVPGSIRRYSPSTQLPASMCYSPTGSSVDIWLGWPSIPLSGVALDLLCSRWPGESD